MLVPSLVLSSVVLATDRSNGERYAVKIYKKKQEKDYLNTSVLLEMEMLEASKSERIIRL